MSKPTNPPTLFSSLVKFQSSVHKIIKDKENPFHKSKYADLSTVIETVKPSLNDAGLVIVQPIIIRELVEEVSPEGKKSSNFVSVLHTRLIHESGESIDSQMIIPPQVDPQKLGSLITYYRRYAYLSIIGLASQSDDDDANMSSNRGSNNQTQSKQTAPQRQLPNNTQTTPKQLPLKGESRASVAQINALRNIYKQEFNPDWEHISGGEASDLIKQANNKKG
jgi:hypothetical protein